MLALIISFFKDLFGLDAPRPTPATPSTGVVSTTPATARPAASIFGPPNLPADRPLTEGEVRAAAAYVTSKYFPAVSVGMLVAMAKIESNFDPRAKRVEKHLNDASWGLMQVLLGTAQDIYGRLKARALGEPSTTKLQDPIFSMYMAAAYVNHLRNFAGTARSEEWIVRAYNGGPGWVRTEKGRTMTLNHWNKYRKARGI